MLNVRRSSEFGSCKSARERPSRMREVEGSQERRDGSARMAADAQAMRKIVSVEQARLKVRIHRRRTFIALAAHDREQQSKSPVVKLRERAQRNVGQLQIS